MVIFDCLVFIYMWLHFIKMSFGDFSFVALFLVRVCLCLSRQKVMKLGLG